MSRHRNNPLTSASALVFANRSSSTLPPTCSRPTASLPRWSLPVPMRTSCESSRLADGRLVQHLWPSFPLSLLCMGLFPPLYFFSFSLSMFRLSMFRQRTLLSFMHAFHISKPKPRALPDSQKTTIPTARLVHPFFCHTLHAVKPPHDQIASDPMLRRAWFPLQKVSATLRGSGGQ